MKPKKKANAWPVPTGGSPCNGRRPEEAGSGRLRKAGRGSREGVGKARSRSYTSEERRSAVEAFQKSGIRQDNFARLCGMSRASLQNWIAKYQEGGPKGLECKPLAGKSKRR